MNNDMILPEAIDVNGMRQSAVALVIVAAMVGTGGSYLTSDAFRDNINPVYSNIQLTGLGTPTDRAPAVDNPNLEFQLASKEFMESFGFNVKQYALLMGVTRPAIYRWHETNAPLAKVRSKNVDRLSQLSEVLASIKEDRRKLLGSWLTSELDNQAITVKAALRAETIDKDSVYELVPEINSALRSLNSSDSLDDLLGIA